MFRRALSFFAIFLFLSLPFVILASTSGPDAELICHTSNQAECYPRIFEPTSDFQIIRDDQDLPSGLHVRLNLETGLKEAKLYDPREDDNPNGQTVHVSSDESLQIVPGEDVMDEPVLGPLSLSDAPEHPTKEAWKPLENLYQKVFKSTSGTGGPKKPAVNSDGDGTAFSTAVELLLKGGEPNDYALDALEDLAHDIYWGQVLAERPQAVQRLTALMADQSDPGVAGRAALVLGNAVHNNDAALRAISSYSYSPTNSDNNSADTAVFEQVVQLLRLDHNAVSADYLPIYEIPPPTYARFVFLLSSLLQNPDYHAIFIEQGYWETLASDGHFSPQQVGSSPRLDRPRAKIADLVLDHIADYSRFPSVRNCRDPYASATSDAAASAASPAEADEHMSPDLTKPSQSALDAYAACRIKADAPMASILEHWQEKLEIALAKIQLTETLDVDTNVVEHVREARDGVKAAREQLSRKD